MERGVSGDNSGMNMQEITELVEMSSKEDRKVERRRRNFRLKMGGAAVVALSLGVISGAYNEGPTETIEQIAQGGEATVKYIDRKFAKQEVISFTTDVDGASATETIKRTGPFNIPLPDIEAGMKIDDYTVISALCFDPGVKKIEETTFPGSDKRHYRVEIDPADISVCSKQDLSVQAVNAPMGNWIELINNASADINRLLGGSDSVDAENQKKSALLQTAQEMAQYNVNKNCGPIVFQEVKDDMKKLIADDVARTENETVEVVYKVSKSGDVAITGQSELDARIKQRQAAGWKLDAGSIGKCEIPASVAGGADERTNNN